ncbi:MAG: TlpA disulfide reductase family protein [Pygmaiobacter sp.]
MKDKKKILLILVAFIAVLLVAQLGYQLLQPRVNAPALQEMPSIGDMAADSSDPAAEHAPDFTVYDASGNSVTLTELMGKPLVLNFWASWCGPCKGEMPDFEAVYQEYGDKVTFVMVNLTGGRETQESAQSYVEGKGYTFPVYFDIDGDAAATYSVSGIPATYIIDADGALVAHSVGAISGDELRKALDGLL